MSLGRPTEAIIVVVPPTVGCVLLATHPVSPYVDPALWVEIHIALSGVLISLAAGLSFLLRRIGRMSPLAALALLVFVSTYVAFDAVVGIAVGILALDGHLASAEMLLRHPLPDALARIGAGAWLVALWSWSLSGSWDKPRLPLILLGLSGVPFALSHVHPLGTVSLALYSIGAALIVWGPEFRSMRLST
jgi:hypothetical protein